VPVTRNKSASTLPNWRAKRSFVAVINVINKVKNRHYMNEKHLLFLDYLLPILSTKYPDGDFIDSIAYKYEKEYNIVFDMNELAFFESSYENKYFTFPYSNLNRTAIITPETKEIIDRDGSLSKYRSINAESKAQEQAKVDMKEQLETELAKSNIEANKLNAKIAEQNSQNESKNRIAMWVNISIGALNIVLIAIQIWLSLQKP
jgi:hypothetical protein